MIRIQAVDAQNLLDVCSLEACRDGIGAAAAEYARCNALSIAEAGYCPELHPNAIYCNHALMGFFLYRRAEQQADTAIIVRFVVDGRFRRDGLPEEALAHILRGLRRQGVHRVIVAADVASEHARTLFRACGVPRPGGPEGAEDRYEFSL